MASQYNARPRPAEVLVEGDGFRPIRRRETYDDLVRGEVEYLDGDRFAAHRAAVDAAD
jgi:diaminopimelate decarboxylase